jgi:hypothetical protein
LPAKRGLVRVLATGESRLKRASRYGWLPCCLRDLTLLDMSAFAVISTTPSNPALEAKVRELYPSDSSTKLSPTVWLVTDQGITPQGVCDKLGVDGTTITHVVVIKVDSYWGRAAKNIWDWLSVKGSDP